jgi:hypothetical protein
LEDHISLVNRGLAEVRVWVQDKGSPSLREASGIPESSHD